MQQLQKCPNDAHSFHEYYLISCISNPMLSLSSSETPVLAG